MTGHIRASPSTPADEPWRNGSGRQIVIAGVPQIRSRIFNGRLTYIERLEMKLEAAGLRALRPIWSGEGGRLWIAHTDDMRQMLSDIGIEDRA